MTRHIFRHQPERQRSPAEEVAGRFATGEWWSLPLCLQPAGVEIVRQSSFSG
jgi:hypothetical protein